MKNQVNKKVSKLLIALLAMVVMCVSGFVLTACKEECTHANLANSADTATCTAGGVIVQTCPDCGYEKIINTPAKGHTYAEGGHVVAPTCTEGGYTETTCTVCGILTKTDLKEALGHDWEETVVQATCTSAGYILKECKNCDVSKKENEVPAIPHTYVKDEAMSQAPTCTVNGYNYVVCECGANKIEPVAATGHAMVVTETSATCTSEGYTTSKCSKCGHTEIDQYTPVLGHTWVKTATLQEKTCTQAGQDEYTCEVCGDTKTLAIPAGHVYDKEPVAYSLCNGETGKHQFCTVCQYENKSEVVVGTLNVNHVWDFANATATTAPTCYNKGYGMATCANENCDAVYVGVLPEIEHIYDIDHPINEAPDCTHAGAIKYACVMCNVTYLGTTINPVGHQFEAKSVAATCETAAYDVNECSVCGAWEKDSYKETAPANGHKMVVSAKVGELADKTLVLDANGNIVEEGLNTILSTCNKFWMDADRNYYAFRCDVCHSADAPTEVKQKGTETTDDGKGHTFPVIKTLEKAVIASTSHDFAGVTADEALSTVVLCEEDGADVQICKACAATAADYLDYTYDHAVQDAAWALTQLGDAGAIKVSNVNITRVECLGHLVTESELYPDKNACIDAAEFKYTCSDCKEVVFQYNEEATAGKEVRAGSTGDVLGKVINIPSEGKVTIAAEQMKELKSEALGHTNDKENYSNRFTNNWQIVTAIDMTADRINKATCANLDKTALCSLTAYEVLNVCTNCGHVDVEDATLGDHKDTKHANYTYTKTADSAAKALVFEKAYYTTDKDGNNAVSTTEDDEKWVYVYTDKTTGKDAYACAGFTCKACGVAVNGDNKHVGDNAVVNCTTEQHCIFCEVLTKETQHVWPEYSCLDNGLVTTDGVLGCVECGKALTVNGNVTAHKSFTKDSLVWVAPTCYSEGYLEVTCGCGTVIKLNAGLNAVSTVASTNYGTVGAKNNVDYDALTAAIAAYNEANEIDIAVNTAIAATGEGALVVNNLKAMTTPHTITVATENVVAPDCCHDGYYWYTCAVEGCTYHEKSLVGQPRVAIKEGEEVKGLTAGTTTYNANPVISALGHTVVIERDVNRVDCVSGDMITVLKFVNTNGYKYEEKGVEIKAGEACACEMSDLVKSYMAQNPSEREPNLYWMNVQEYVDGIIDECENMSSAQKAAAKAAVATALEFGVDYDYTDLSHNHTVVSHPLADIVEIVTPESELVEGKDVVVVFLCTDESGKCNALIKDTITWDEYQDYLELQD